MKNIFKEKEKKEKDSRPKTEYFLVGDASAFSSTNASLQGQSSSNPGGKYSTIYVSKGSANAMIGEILYSSSDTIDKLREAISIECGVAPGFIMKISSQVIEPGKRGFDLVSSFLNPDFPVVIVDPQG